jgi:hypothetical protein
MTTPTESNNFYAMPDSGGEYAYNNFYDPRRKLDELNVAGRVEWGGDPPRSLMLSRAADGTWTEPEGRGYFAAYEGDHEGDHEGGSEADYEAENDYEDDEEEVEGNDYEDEDLNVGSIVFPDLGRQDELPARYAAAHAEIMAGDYASLQTDIDSGEVWSMADGAVALAMKMLTVGGVMAPSVETTHPEGVTIPTVWTLDGTNGRGSIQGAEAYIANRQVSSAPLPERKIAEIPDCAICQLERKIKRPAYADAKIPGSAWFHLCRVCFARYKCELGTGTGLVLVEVPGYDPDEGKYEYRANMEQIRADDDHDPVHVSAQDDEVSDTCAKCGLSTTSDGRFHGRDLEG